MGRIHLVGGEATPLEIPMDQTPFRILCVGDFSGRRGRGAHSDSLAGRRPISIDRDNLEEVLIKLQVEIHIPRPANAAGHVAIPIRELDDFCPDRLFEGLELFESLRDVRRRLGSPKTFAVAAQEVGRWAGSPPAAEPSPPAIQRPMPSDSAALLEQMLGGAPLPGVATQPGSQLDAFLRSVGGPHLVPAENPRQAELEAVVDEAIGGAMRVLLHHPDFQEIEAAWRGLHLLVRRLETNENLKIFLLDLTRDELVTDLTRSDNPGDSRLYDLLVREALQTTGGQPWAVIAGHYTFGPGHDDASLLQRLTAIAEHAGAPFVAAAHPLLFDCHSLSATQDPEGRTQKPDAETFAAWERLRHSSAACFLALAAPRFLLRYTYGPDTSPVERFDFKELTDPPHHEDFLWGNPAFAVAALLGQAFSVSGWSMQPGEVPELDGLPVVAYGAEDEKELKPCAEVDLNEQDLERMLDAGVLALLSVPRSGSVRVARFQAFASPQTQLAGRWGSP
jgi:type VI secretion system protein ImpC